MYWGALAAVEGIGRVTLFRIWEWCQKKHISIEEFWRNARFWSVAGLSASQVKSLTKWQTQGGLDRFTQVLKVLNLHMIGFWQPEYPTLLQELPDKPFLLFIQGDLQKLTLFSGPAVAVVGTRKPTGYGVGVTKRLTTELVERGCPIISGFMTGVDQLAHQACMSAEGVTVGVLGYGHTHVFPAHLHHFRREFLLAGNILVSEFAPQIVPKKGQFPVRNRIVAGLAQATIVIEAGEKSGSLLTAEAAVTYNRAVGAVPGAITSFYSAGCHKLLQEGAALITKAADVYEAIGLPAVDISPMAMNSASSLPTDETMAEVLRILQSQTASTEELLLLTRYSQAEILAALSTLELQERVVFQGGEWAILC